MHSTTLQTSPKQASYEHLQYSILKIHQSHFLQYAISRAPPKRMRSTKQTTTRRRIILPTPLLVTPSPHPYLDAVGPKKEEKRARKCEKGRPIINGRRRFAPIKININSKTLPFLENRRTQNHVRPKSKPPTLLSQRHPSPIRPRVNPSHNRDPVSVAPERERKEKERSKRKSSVEYPHTQTVYHRWAKKEIRHQKASLLASIMSRAGPAPSPP